MAFRNDSVFLWELKAKKKFVKKLKQKGRKR